MDSEYESSDTTSGESHLSLSPAGCLRPRRSRTGRRTAAGPPPRRARAGSPWTSTCKSGLSGGGRASVGDVGARRGPHLLAASMGCGAGSAAPPAGSPSGRSGMCGSGRLCSSASANGPTPIRRQNSTDTVEFNLFLTKICDSRDWSSKKF